MPLIPLLGFAPDLDRMTPGVVTDCSQLIPSNKGMQAAPSNIAASYPELSEAVTGSALLVALDGSVRFIAGSASALNEGAAGAWTDRSRVGGYSASSARWRFAQFGNSALAANKTAALQRSTTGAFANLTAPKAAFIDTLQNFTLVADFDDTGMAGFTNLGDTRDGWWCSAFDDCTSWTPSVATQSARGRLVAVPGPITGLKRLGPNAAIYKERTVFLGRYVGASDGVFRWEPIKSAVGCASNEAVVNIGAVHFFVGETDFYAFDGNEPVEIGQHIRSWFFDRLNPGFVDQVAGLHDRANGHIWWFYPGPDSATGELDSAVVYDYRLQRWGTADRDAEIPIEVVLDGVTYGTLGDLFATYGDLTAIPYGSPFWSSGKPIPAVFGTDHKPYTISGTPGDWTLRTGLYGDDARTLFMNRLRVRWVTKPAAATMTNRYAMDAGNAMTVDASRSMNATRGHFDMRRSANWHQFDIAASGSAELVGIDMDGQEAGAR